MPKESHEPQYNTNNMIPMPNDVLWVVCMFVSDIPCVIRNARPWIAHFVSKMTINK